MIYGASRVAPEKAVFRPALAMSFLPGISEMHMSEIRKLTHNVWDFLNEAAVRHGKIQEQRFSQRVFAELIENGSGSPIEDLFFIACRLQCEARYITFNPSPDIDRNDKIVWASGLLVQMQVKVDKYKVDFVLRSFDLLGDETFSPAVIELDGHAFHDKDKKQRSYEKARDRCLVKEGYRVLHYTGSEVVADPYRVAHEAMQLVGAIGPDDVYDPKNPVGFD